MSATRPEGKEETAEARMKPVTIQLNNIASAPNSPPIAGNATFKEEAIKVLKNTARDAAMSVIVLLLTKYYTPKL
jgi:hypothetical protein